MRIRELYADVIAEDTNYEYKAVLDQNNPVHWAKTIIGYANGSGGVLFVGVSNGGEAFGIDLDEIDKTKLLISRVNDRHIFPHIKISYMMRSTDADAEKFVLGIKVVAAESVVRYREGDYNETVYVKGDGNATPATPEEIISLSKRKYGIDNETTENLYCEKKWTEYLDLCKRFREDRSIPGIKELQNEEIISKDGYAKSGFMMFADGYDQDDSMICCRLWKGKNKTGILLDSNRMKGSLAMVLADTLNFVERNTRTGWAKTWSGGRAEIRSYPREAVREALVNAVAHRDYSIAGTQIDVDIYSDRMEIVSPGSWLLPKDYYEYPIGSIPSIRRNAIIAACLDVANLMERGGTGFQTMMESYKDAPENMQPVVSIYPGFLSLKLYDELYDEESPEFDYEGMTDVEKVIAVLKAEGPKPVKDLQAAAGYHSRALFLKNVINPLLNSEKIYRDGKTKSPAALIKLGK